MKIVTFLRVDNFHEMTRFLEFAVNIRAGNSKNADETSGWKTRFCFISTSPMRLCGRSSLTAKCIAIHAPLNGPAAHACLNGESSDRLRRSFVAARSENVYHTMNRRADFLSSELNVCVTRKSMNILNFSLAPLDLHIIIVPLAMLE